MASLTTLHLEHLPPSLVIYIAHLRDVRNASFLRQQLLAGNAEFEYALVDANTILSTTHLLAAVFRAVNDLNSNRLKSRNVHSEIVFALSPNNNIAESFRRFGITDNTTNLLVVKLSTSPDVSAESVSQHLNDSFQGTPIEFNDETLMEKTDVAKVKKIYKLNTLSSTKSKRGKAGDIENDGVTFEKDSRKELEVAVLGLMALRGAS